MARILLVDDDDFYRSALKTVIQNFGHDVIEVHDGKDAQQILGVQKYDLLISDIRMPTINGIELLQWTKKRLQIPVILMTGFSEILETNKAGQIGADDFLLKPFKGSDLNLSIQRLTATDVEKKEKRDDLDSKYCKVPIEDFISGSRIHCSIFTRISSDRYIRIAYQGEDLEHEKIMNYKRNGLKYLYLAKEDYGRYVHFSCSPLEPESQDFLKMALAALEDTYITGTNMEDYVLAKEFVESVFEVIQYNDEVANLLVKLNEHADFVFEHSVVVAIYTVVCARSMGWTSTPVLFKIALAGLLHDTGLLTVPREILDKSRESLTQEERASYETHCSRGSEILSHLRGLPEGVSQIALQHHETADGCGYPAKLSKNKAYPLARLMAVAEVFCDYTHGSPQQKKLNCFEAIEQMNRLHRNALDPESFAAFKKLFIFDTLAELTSKKNEDAV